MSLIWINHCPLLFSSTAEERTILHNYFYLAKLVRDGKKRLTIMGSHFDKGKNAFVFLQHLLTAKTACV